MTAVSKRVVLACVGALVVAVAGGGAFFWIYNNGLPTRGSSGTKPPAVALAPAAGDTLVVTQAKNAGVRTCIESVTRDSSVLTGRYGSLSRWSTEAPDDHLFQAVLALRMPETDAPNGLGLIVAAPSGLGCDSATLQIQTVPQSCEAIQASRAQGNAPLTDFNGVLMSPSDGGVRQFFLTASSDRCVVVSSAIRMSRSTP